MDIGRLLGSAGRIGGAWRQEEDLQRQSRQTQLQTDRMLRDDATQREVAGLQLSAFEPVGPLQFSEPFVPGQGMPMVDAPAPVPTTAGMPAPTAPATKPGAAPAARPAVSAAPVAAPAVPLTPDQIRQGQNRLALLRGPTAAVDVAQAPFAAGLNVAGDLAARGLNLAGRGLNYTFGTNLATNYSGPQFSLTPFYDQFVRRPEQQLQPTRPGYTDAQGRSIVDQIPGARPAPAASAAPTAPELTPAAQKRLTTLTTAAPQALQSAGAQQVISRAQALGIDPVAAATLYGIETSYGANTGTSSRGARGPMQVTDLTFTGMKRWYTDPKNIAQYNIPDEVVQAARAMTRGNPQGEIDAGLLRLNYNKLIGLPQDLWGAAYQTNAEKVLKAGAPLGLSDGGLSNGDYNSIFNSLYPVIAQSMGGGTGSGGSTGTPAAAAPTTAPAAAPIAAPTAAPASPLAVPRTQTENVQMADRLLARPETIPFELQQLQDFAQQQAALLTRQRNDAARLAQVYQRSGTTNGLAAAERLRATIEQADAGLLAVQQGVAQKEMYLQGMQGLREFATAQDPRRLSGVLSKYMGVPVGIQPRSDGRYNYFVNGERVREGMTAEQVAETAMREFSPAAREAVTASAALRNKLQLQLQYDPSIKKAQIDAMAKLFEAQTDGEYRLQLEALKQRGIEVKPDATTGKWAIIVNGREVLIVDPNEMRQQQTPFGQLTLPPTARRIGLDVGR